MNRLHLHTLDTLILIAYFVVTIIIGFRGRQRSTSDFMVGSRSLGLASFVATLVATWYGGILAVGEFTYQMGLANWTTQGLPYYLFAILFALFLAERVRGGAHYTIPDKLAEVYGKPAALVGAMFAFVMVTPGPYVLMTGQLMQTLTGWPILICMVIGTALSVAYVYVGGFMADVRINVFQFVLMFAGFTVALATLAWTLGGPHWVSTHLPVTHLRLDGGQDAGFILVWFFIAFWTLVDPGFHQRCYAVRSPRTAKIGILVAVGCWMVFDFLTTSTGLYARAALPNLTIEQQPFAFTILADQLLPAGVRGFFFVALLATVMSTVVSYTFMAGMTIGRDVIWRLKSATNADSETGSATPLIDSHQLPSTPIVPTNETTLNSIPRYTRFGLTITTVLAIAICLAVPDVVKQWFTIGTVCVPGLLLPVIACYYPRLRIGAGWTVAAMVIAAGLSLACLMRGWVGHGLTASTDDFPFHTQPMYVGLASSGIVYLVGKLSMPQHGPNT